MNFYDPIPRETADAFRAAVVPHLEAIRDSMHEIEKHLATLPMTTESGTLVAMYIEASKAIYRLRGELP